MSTAVVCAHLNWRSPSVAASVATKSYNVASSSTAGLLFQPQQQSYGGSPKGYTSLACQASSGGTRRDYEKILARQNHRRVRHMKGVTPSTPDLINTLEAEKRDQAKLDSRLDGVNDDEEYYNYEDEADEDDDDEESQDSDSPDVRPA